MSVETTTRKTRQTMTALLTQYDFTFRALVSAPEDIKCIRTITATNVDEDMTYVADLPDDPTVADVLKYTVTVNDDGVGGTVEVAWISTACTITIYRETTDTQASDYEDYNQFPASTVENDFDKRTMVTQEIQEDLARSLKYAITAPTGSTLPAGEAHTFIGWDANGVLLENKTIATGGTILIKASQTDAEVGTDNADYMTPLRVRQSLSYIDVRSYGAVGDGTTDDSTAIQSAINTGKNIFFPAGTYLIGTGLTVDTEGQILQGAGMELSIIKASAAIDMATAKQRRICFRDLEFNGNSLATRGIRLNMPSSYIEHCYITGTTTTAIECDGDEVTGYSFSDYILFNTIINNLGTGIFLSTGGHNNNMHIVGNYLSGNSKFGIDIQAGGDYGLNYGYSVGIYIQDNAFEGNCSGGSVATPYSVIRIGGGTRLVNIDNCYFETDINQTGWEEQLYIDIQPACFNVSIRNCYMASLANYHIKLSTAYPVIVENCHFYGWGTAYINDVDPANSRLSEYGNIISVGFDLPYPMFSVVGTLKANSVITTKITTLANDATPSVLGGSIFKTGGTTTITDFDDGVTGQIITIISEHAITITDGTNIFLNGSANFVMASSDTLTLVCHDNGLWLEVSRSDNT